MKKQFEKDVEKFVDKNLTNNDWFEITYTTFYEVLSIIYCFVFIGFFVLSVYCHVISGVIFFGICVLLSIYNGFNIAGFYISVDRKKKIIFYQRFFFYRKIIMFSDVKYVKLKDWNNTTKWIAYDATDKKLCEVNLSTMEKALTLKTIFDNKERKN